MANPATPFDYSEFDNKMLSLIAGGVNTFTRLQSLLEADAKQFDPKLGRRFEPFRVADRRLQALRKSGKVNFQSRTGWTVPPSLGEA